MNSPSTEPLTYPRVTMCKINMHAGLGEYVDAINNAADAEPDDSKLQDLRAIWNNRYQQCVGIDATDRYAVLAQAEEQVRNQAVA